MRFAGFFPPLACVAVCMMLVCAAGSLCTAQSPSPLERQLLSEDAAQLAAEATRHGDAQRGAVLFHQPWMTCTQCHAAPGGLGAGERHTGEQRTGEQAGWAPELARAEPRPAGHLVQALLRPSQEIQPEYQVSNVVTVDGKVFSGFLLPEPSADGKRRLRSPTDGQLTEFSPADVEVISPQAQSAMPTGLVSQLTSRVQFLDLIAYLQAIREGGPQRARQLQPLPSQIAARPLPQYEAHIDHAQLIGTWDDESFRRGEAIYQRLCINCHGDLEQPGSMPTSLRFATGTFKNGSDPYAMYQTLTRGSGAMVAQDWMVPQQKYDVIHYIREHYLKAHNRQQLTDISADYLASLPPGDSLGPAPVESEPWEQMNYGPNLIATLEVGSDGHNFAHKGNAIRLDHGPGGVSQGSHWIVYDTDTMRVAAAWRSSDSDPGRFIDYNGINFNGRHAVHPRVVGEVLFDNPTGPGWADPAGDFADRRVLGRDDRQYGPLPRPWAHYKGMYAHGLDTILHYSVGDADILEMPSLQPVSVTPPTETVDSSAKNSAGETDVVQRQLTVQPHSQPLVMQVAHFEAAMRLAPLAVPGAERDTGTWAIAEPPAENPDAAHSGDEHSAAHRFDGKSYLRVAGADSWNMLDRDYAVVVRFRTKHDGTLFAKTADQAKWAPDGKALFVRGGKLCFDIGWVGAVESKRRVDDGNLHTAAVLYDAQQGEVTLLIDGQLERTQKLKPKSPVSGHEIRIGFAAENFPADPFFRGSIERLQLYQRRFAPSDWQKLSAFALDEQVRHDALWADYDLQGESQALHDRSGHGHHAERPKPQKSRAAATPFVVGAQGNTSGLQWQLVDGNVRLLIPPTSSARVFTIHHFQASGATDGSSIAGRLERRPVVHDLAIKTQGGPRRWQQSIAAQTRVHFDDGPFAVDQLTYPQQNPWFCRMRLTGLDFFSGGDGAAVCDWDGNVWRVDGLARLPSGDGSADATSTLQWTRVASGLFQPLGLKIIDDQVFVGCRDQICVLRDLNGDGETDYYENFNNDHQVTEHFHEFAMGLQADSAGNLYYAKSARHALKAVVPHHGTLLKVARDGSTTEILASGFRAANGVCLNPDGTFFVTDQEGHWNPKNRINWVRPGGFYGNMFGYHDVSDDSDAAMEPPLCWITNAFDRSPAELLWVDSENWGPLNGSLLNLSYGNGKIFIVPHERLTDDLRGSVAQGGMCELPVPAFPTGIHRGRFHPGDGQLYLCGMFAWGGNQQQDGGLYRVRYTGQPVLLPRKLIAAGDRVQIHFTDELDPAKVSAEDFQITTWALKRSANYGSDHYDTRTLDVAEARLSADQRTVSLRIPDLRPTWCMEIRYRLEQSGGKPIDGVIHNTIHRLD